MVSFSSWKKKLRPLRRFGQIKQFYPPIHSYSLLDGYLNYIHLEDEKPDQNKLFLKFQRNSLFILSKGIQTGKNNIFVVDPLQFPEIKSPVYRPFLQGQEIVAFKSLQLKRKIIISHRFSSLIDEIQKNSDLIPLYQYLSQHKQELLARTRINETSWHYWRFGDEHRNIDFDLPKIVWIARGKEMQATYDLEGYYHGQNVVLLTLNWKKLEVLFTKEEYKIIKRLWQEKMIHFYVGLFNSSIFHSFLIRSAIRFQNNDLSFQPTTFKQIPIPLFIPTDINHNNIISITQNIERLMANDLNSKINLKEQITLLNNYCKKLYL